MSKPKDSMAMAYNMRRRSKARKMAYGGDVEKPIQPGENEQKARNQLAGAFGAPKPKEDKPIQKAHGGEIKMKRSIVDALMKRRKAKMMADGGEVDLGLNEMEVQPNDYDDQNEMAALKELYDDELDNFPQPEDSNEHSVDMEDEDAHDMVSAIRKRIRAKRGM